MYSAFAPEKRPRALDLFCGAGGATKGLQRAGFFVVGIDIKKQPRYCGDLFIQADALKPPVRLEDFDLIWASPPCQAYVNLSKQDGRHPKLIEPARQLLSGHLYVIENVEGAPLISPIRLCGSMFGLGVRRHRLFETRFVWSPQCHHSLQGDDIRAYYGKPGWMVCRRGGAQVQKKGRKPLLRGSVEQAPEDMGIDWMATWDELREAIPPDYAEFIGKAALAYLAQPPQRKSASGAGR
jgi:DNA (cytosine-5)-methyltransferase 1